MSHSESEDEARKKRGSRDDGSAARAKAQAERRQRTYDAWAASDEARAWVKLHAADAVVWHESAENPRHVNGRHCLAGGRVLGLHEPILRGLGLDRRMAACYAAHLSGLTPADVRAFCCRLRGEEPPPAAPRAARTAPVRADEGDLAARKAAAAVAVARVTAERERRAALSEALAERVALADADEIAAPRGSGEARRGADARGGRTAGRPVASHPALDDEELPF